VRRWRAGRGVVALVAAALEGVARRDTIAVCEEQRDLVVGVTGGERARSRLLRPGARPPHVTCARSSRLGHSGQILP
jgi:hypothetical protein